MKIFEKMFKALEEEYKEVVETNRAFRRAFVSFNHPEIEDEINSSQNFSVRERKERGNIFGYRENGEFYMVPNDELERTGIITKREGGFFSGSLYLDIKKLNERLGELKKEGYKTLFHHTHPPISMREFSPEDIDIAMKMENLDFMAISTPWGNIYIDLNILKQIPKEKIRLAMSDANMATWNQYLSQRYLYGI